MTHTSHQAAPITQTRGASYMAFWLVSALFMMLLVWGVTPALEAQMPAPTIADLLVAEIMAVPVNTPTTIHLLAGATYTFTQATSGGAALPSILNKIITIEGHGAVLRRDPQLTSTTPFGFFDIQNPGSLTLKDMTLYNSYGSAIKNAGTLWVERVIFSNNTAPGYGQGGAINTYEYSQLTVKNSVFIRNKADQGGAINSWHNTLILEGNIFRLNTAYNHGKVLTIRNKPDTTSGIHQLNKNRFDLYRSISSVIAIDGPSWGDPADIDATNNWWDLGVSNVGISQPITKPVTLIPAATDLAAIQADFPVLDYTHDDDLDGDGLPNLEEESLGTSPLNADTDGDGLEDGAEYVILTTNPLLGDTDGDTLSDYDEVYYPGFPYASNPKSVNSDSNSNPISDSLPDNYERILGTDPRDGDTDNDGISDNNEHFDDDLWTNYDEFIKESDPLRGDTDGDQTRDDLDNCLLIPNDQDNIDILSEIASGEPIRGDECDTDYDNDGYLNAVDTCPYIANPDQEDIEECTYEVLSTVNSTFDISPEPSVPAQQIADDGLAFYTLTFTLRDSNNKVVKNYPVSLTSSSTTLAMDRTSGNTSEFGTFIVKLYNTVPESATVTITAHDPTSTQTVDFTSKLITYVGADVTVSVEKLPSIMGGDTLIYGITVTNAGTRIARDIEVFAGLPLNQTVIKRLEPHNVLNSVTPENVYLIEETPASLNKAIWMITSLAPGASEKFYVYALTNTNLQLGTAVRLEASVRMLNDIDMRSADNDNRTQLPVVISVARIIETPPPPVPPTPIPAAKMEVTYAVKGANTSAVSAAIGDSVELEVTIKNTSAEILYNVKAFAPLIETFFSSYSPLSILTIAEWPDKAHPGKLVPGDTVTATFTYLMTREYLQHTERQRSAWATAQDSTGKDVVVRNILNNTGSGAELKLAGAVVDLKLVSDRTVANPGETITFTLTASNEAGAGADVDNLEFRHPVTGLWINLGTLPIGGTLSETFTYDVEGIDKPQLNMLVEVKGSHNPGPGKLSETLRQVIPVVTKVVTATEPHSDLAITVNTNALEYKSLTITGRTFTVPLLIHNLGNTKAPQVSVQMKLPPGVTPVYLSNGIVNDTTGTITWSWPNNMLEPGPYGFYPLMPTFKTSAATGNTVRLDFKTISGMDETDYTNNTVIFSVPVVNAQPTVVTLTSINILENLDQDIIVDGQDKLTLKITVKDQLGAVVPNATGFISTGVLGVDFVGATATDSIGVTTDSAGQASIDFKASDIGLAALTADFGTASATLNIRRLPSALQVDRSLVVGTGGKDAAIVSMLNTSSTADTFSFEVEGIDSSLVTFIPNKLGLSLGQSEKTSLLVQVPPGQCMLVGTYNVTVKARSEIHDTVVATTTLQVQITGSSPSLTQAFPGDTTLLGNAKTLFGWRSNTPTSSQKVYIRPTTVANNGLYTSYDLIANQQDPTFYSTIVTLPALGAYDWYGETTTGCGSANIGTAGLPLHVTRVKEASFVSRSYSYNVEDDYDQTTDEDGQPMSVSVRNDYTEPLKIQVTTEDVYPDLILGFTGAGSRDAYLVVPAGKTVTLPLRVFTQQTRQEKYTLTLNLSVVNVLTNKPVIVDRVPLTLVIAQPNMALALINAETHPRTMVTRVTLLNTAEGDTLTDLNLQVVDAETGAPADFIIQPDIRHAYFPKNSSVELEIIPVDVTGYIPSTLSTETPRYKVRATSRVGQADLVVTAKAEAEFAIDNMCGAMKNEQTISQSCFQMPGEETYSSAGAYCTNQPHIDMNIPWALDSQMPLTSVTAGMSFSPGSREHVFNHATQLFFNNVSLGGGVVPEQGSFSFNVPLDAVIPGARFQTLNLRSEHNNSAHYVVSSGAYVTVRYGSFNRNACYSPAEISTGSMMSCADGECQMDISASNLRVVPKNGQLEMTVRIGSGGTQYVPEGINVAFYNGNPESGGMLIPDPIDPSKPLVLKTTRALNPGEFEDLIVMLPLNTVALPLYIAADDRGGMLDYVPSPELDEGNNIYAPDVYLSPDLTTTRVDTANTTTNVHTLLIGGQVAVDIVSPVKVNKPFTLMVFEDLDRDGAYEASNDTVLGEYDVKELNPNTALRVNVPVSGQVSFAGTILSVFVDSRNTATETNENNNVQASVPCTTSCDGASPDLIPSNLRQPRSDEPQPNTNNSRLILRVGNGGGTIVDTDVTVKFYKADPAIAVESDLLGTKIITSPIAPGKYVIVELDIPTSSDATPVWVYVDQPTLESPNGTVIESDERNNVYSSNVFITDNENAEPDVTAGPDVKLLAPDWTTTLHGIVIDDLPVSLPMGMVTTLWTVTEFNQLPVTTAESRNVVFSRADSVVTSITFKQEGLYELTLTATDGAVSTSDRLLVTVVTPPVPQRTMTQTNCIIQPAPLNTDPRKLQMVTAQTPITLVADNAPGMTSAILNSRPLTEVAVFVWPINHPENYRLVSQDGSVDPTTGALKIGSNPVYFDPTVLANDMYVVQITGKNAVAQPVACGVAVTVAGENKPGRVALTTTDIVVPLAGLPITIGRAYDSLERDYVGDFGHGWSLAIGAPRMEVASNSNVTLTMPDGHRRTFFFAPTIGTVWMPFLLPGYMAEPGEYGSFTAQSCTLVVAGTNGFNCFLSGVGSAGYNDNVTSYHYKDPYGRMFTFDQSGTLKTITDLTGNTLSFAPDGIKSNACKVEGGITTCAEVKFKRVDNLPQNRIDEITTPDGKVYKYHYNGVGDLVTVELPKPDPVSSSENPIITYTYYSERGWEHFLKEGYDANRNRVATMTYYDDGRLKSVDDSLNNPTAYAYNLNADGTTQTTITNPDGGIIERNYDAKGNLKSEEDALLRVTQYEYYPDNNLRVVKNHLGEETKYTYDGRGNRTSIVNALGTTLLTAQYNAFGGPTKLVDALGNIRTIDYDPDTAMPSSGSDALDTLGSYKWTEQGSPDIVTDAVGKKTNFDYNSYGNLTREIDARGNIIDYTYDDMGRRLTRTTYKDANAIPSNISTVTTTTYDALGRVRSVVTRDKDGNIEAEVKYDYDANGNRTTVEDAAGVTTTYIFDKANRVEEVQYADGTKQTFKYDFRGNVTEQIVVTNQPEGNDYGLKDLVSTKEYDLAGQLIKVTAVYGPNENEQMTMSYGYDGAGRLTTTILGVGLEDDDGDSLERPTTRTYDAAGRLLTIENALGQVTTYTYNALGQVTSVTDALGHITRYGYDIRGRRIQTIMPNGTISLTEYDLLNRVILTTDPSGIQSTTEYDDVGNVTDQVYAANTSLKTTTHFEYDLLGRQTSVTSAFETDKAATTQYLYDDMGRVIQTTDPRGAVTKSTYNLLGQLETTSTPDDLGTGFNTTTYFYDDLGRTIKVLYPDGTDSETVYTGGRITKSLDTSDIATVYTYDAAGRTKTVTSGYGTIPDLSATTTYTYDLFGQQTRVTDARNHTTTYEYDNLGRTVLVRDAEGNESSSVYNEIGQLAARTDANGHTTCYVYDEMGRLETTILPPENGSTTKCYEYDVTGRLNLIILPGSSTTTSSYDLQGQQLSSTDPNGKTTRYEYDAIGRLAAVSNPMGLTTTYGYDIVGQLTSITDPKGQETEFFYNVRGEQIKKVWADDTFEQFDYTLAGNLMKHTWSGFDLTSTTDDTFESFSYDNMDRVTKTVFSDTSEYRYAYVPVSGELDTVKDKNDVILADYNYDAIGRPTTVINPYGQSVGYTYDKNGNRESLITPAGTTTYTYDALDRLEMVEDPQEGETWFTYDPLGLLDTMTLPNGVTSDYTYDDRNQVIGLMQYKTIPNNPLATFSYGYDDAGNRISSTEVIGTTTANLSYTYDDAYRLKSETRTVNSVALKTAYTYDDAGNRETQTRSNQTTTYTYNQLDQLTKEVTTTGTQVVTSLDYIYDGRGNIKTLTSGALITSYQWNAQNQLIGMTLPTGAISYSYDPTGQRISQTAAGVTTRYLWDSLSPYGDVVAETDAGNVVQTSYILAEGMLLGQTKGTETLYRVPDVQGSTRLMTNADGVITSSYNYDAFGELFNPPATLQTNYLYTGQQYDANTGNYSLRARFYDPSNGRFMSRDAYTGNYDTELNRYAYTANNPITRSDPSGYMAIETGSLNRSSFRAAFAAAFASVPLQQAFGWTAALIATASGATFAGLGVRNWVDDWAETAAGSDFFEKIYRHLMRAGAASSCGLGGRFGSVNTNCLATLDYTDANTQATDQTNTDVQINTRECTAEEEDCKAEESPDIVRHYTTERSYNSITSTGRYIFNPRLTTDPLNDSTNAIYFAPPRSFDSLQDSLFGPYIISQRNYGDKYNSNKYHPLVIQFNYAIRNLSNWSDLVNDVSEWPMCFIEIDKNKLEGNWRSRVAADFEWVYYVDATISALDVTDAVIRSGPVSLLDAPNPALPEVPFSACSGGIKRG